MNRYFLFFNYLKNLKHWVYINTQIHIYLRLTNFRVAFENNFLKSVNLIFEMFFFFFK